MMFDKFINKYVKCIKNMNGTNYYYHGTLLEENELFIVLDDRMNGLTWISKSNLSSLQETKTLQKFEKKIR